MPPPLQPPRSVAELLASGESLLEHFGLWDWWKPTSWLRYVYEYVHLNTDLPWVVIIPICATVIRLSILYIPLKIQRFSAKQLKYQSETLEFTKRIQEARLEGNFMLVQQVLMEQRDFNRQKGLNKMILPLIGFQAGVFITQFLAIRGLAIAKFPGFRDEGFLWVRDLTIADPYWVLPIANAVAMHFVFRSGIETGNAEVMPPIMRTFLFYGAPIFIMFTSSYMPAAIPIYWITNSSLSIIFALVFKTEIAQRIFKLPPPGSKQAIKRQGFLDSVQDYSNARKSYSALKVRDQDMEQFKRAGRSRPHIFPGQEEQQKDQK